MTRLLLALAGVVLLAVTALGAVWLLGQLLTGLGVFIVGAAGVLGRLLWFLMLTGLLSGAVYFVASAWRPTARLRPHTPVTRAPVPSPLNGGPARPPAPPARAVAQLASDPLPEPLDV